MDGSVNFGSLFFFVVAKSELRNEIASYSTAQKVLQKYFNISVVFVFAVE
jgi:hypothetical protein